MTSIFIGIPSGDLVSTDFALSLVDAISNTDAEICVHNIRTPVIQQSRNALAKYAIEHGAVWTLFLDSDMVFPSDSITKLLSNNRDIVPCNYRRRSASGETMKIGPAGNVEVCGMGMFLIKTKILAELEMPLFAEEGEDYYFCRKLRKAGYTMYPDLEVSRTLGHVAQQIKYL